jgi:hypothetical protein
LALRDPIGALHAVGPPGFVSACLQVTDASALIPTSEQTPPDPESPPPGGTSRPAPAAPSSWKKFVAWVLQRVRDLAGHVWKFAFDVAQYYWGMRHPLREYVAGFLPDLASESKRMREVRLNPDESHRMAEFGPEGWKVSILGRCVVCGERTQNPPVDESKLVENAARAFWIPAAALLLGLSIGWFLYGRWIATLSLPLGLAAGYLLRGTVPVLLRLARCNEHTTRLNIPQVLAWGNTLVLRFGHKSVRKVFLYGETMDFTVPQPDAPAGESNPAGAQSESAYVPETIPLADSPDPKDSQITHDLPPTFGPDDPSKSPTVP